MQKKKKKKGWNNHCWHHPDSHQDTTGKPRLLLRGSYCTCDCLPARPAKIQACSAPMLSLGNTETRQTDKYMNMHLQTLLKHKCVLQMQCKYTALGYDQIDDNRSKPRSNHCQWKPMCFSNLNKITTPEHPVSFSFFFFSFLKLFNFLSGYSFMPVHFWSQTQTER